MTTLAALAVAVYVAIVARNLWQHNLDEAAGWACAAVWAGIVAWGGSA